MSEMAGLILAGKKYYWLVTFFIYQPFWLVSQKVNFEPCVLRMLGDRREASCSSQLGEDKCLD